MIITNKQLIDWNKKGLIPRKGESEKMFLDRCLEAKTYHNLEYLSHLDKLYDVKPDWVNCFFDDQNLHFWEGGCTWENENQISIQLRKRLREETKLFGVYSKEEILSHELVHAVRMQLSEERFEEALAYKTSSSKFRKYFGPLLRSSKESLLFFGLVFLYPLSIFSPAAHLASLLAMLTLISFAIVRLHRMQRCLKKAEHNLTAVFGNKAKAVLLRLTDQEITLFSHSSPCVILQYAETERSRSLRWKQICVCYLDKQISE